MKKLILTLSLAMAYFGSYAQQIGSSPIYYNGSYVGIGAATPGAALEINTQNNGHALVVHNIPNNSGNIALRLMNASSNPIIEALGNGNVGIGTTNPGQLLSVAYPYSKTDATQRYISEFKSNDSSNPFALTIGAIGASTLSNRSITLQTADNNLANGGNLLLQRYGGNVGIGTTSPDEILTVNGSIHSKKVRVDNSVPVPDYVFEPDYKLQDLNDIKSYVDKNHHLPEIPSATQIEKEGINLGDMNMKLLQKVEELTLYIIQQNERINKLEEKLKTNKAE